MSFIVTVIAASGAIGAAWYTSKAVEEARKQNDIARFEKRLEIYHALGKFRTMLATKGLEYPEDALWEFESAVQLSEFYFPREISRKFSSIFANAKGCRSFLDQYGMLHSSPSTMVTMSNYAQSSMARADRASKQLQGSCTELFEEVRSHLAKLADQVT